MIKKNDRVIMVYLRPSFDVGDTGTVIRVDDRGSYLVAFDKHRGIQAKDGDYMPFIWVDDLYLARLPVTNFIGE